jgi:acetyl-CoA acetyltransferase
MIATLNACGDVLIRTTGRHGGDISSQRMDDLDIAALAYALQLKGTAPGAAIDLGCGQGMQGLRLAALGLDTLLIDSPAVGGRVTFEYLHG